MVVREGVVHERFNVESTPAELVKLLLAAAHELRTLLLCGYLLVVEHVPLPLLYVVAAVCFVRFRLVELVHFDSCVDLLVLCIIELHAPLVVFALVLRVVDILDLDAR